MVARLMLNYLEQQPLPPKPSSTLLGSAYSFLFTPQDKLPDCLIADKSILLFLLLSNQKAQGFSNEFQLCIYSIVDLSEEESGSEIRLSFRMLLDIFCL